MTTQTDVSWFRDLVDPSSSPLVKDSVWRCHAQDVDDFFAEYLPPRFLAGLIEDAAIDWRAAIEKRLVDLADYCPSIVEYTRDYFFETYRSDFVEEMNLRPGMSVLDMACGWGFSSQRCLEKQARVVGTEIAVHRLQFCARRFQQQGYGDRFVGVELDANRPFPFRERVFDAVIVSGLLEWLACSTCGHPPLIQRTFLDRVFQVLKPGGTLYLAIENRYWWRYFLGHPDLHTNQRWVSILPRRIARAFSIVRFGTDYRAYCYSLAKYINWFRECGFRTVSVSYPKPDYVQPKSIVPLISNLSLTTQSPLSRRAIEAQSNSVRLGRFGRSFMFFVTK